MNEKKNTNNTQIIIKGEKIHTILDGKASKRDETRAEKETIKKNLRIAPTHRHGVCFNIPDGEL